MLNGEAARSLVGFHEDIHREVISFDGLWVLGSGLGLASLEQYIIEQFESNKDLVIVLNAEPTDFDPLFAQRHQLIVAEGISAQQRKARYLKGGILFITSRILVVDLLRQRLPTHLIAGFIVSDAHRVNESSTESFILRLYRETNKSGFIKAFSDQPQAFTSGGFGVSLERAMRSLFLKKVFLWPRFKKGVTETLDSKQPDVTQTFVALSPFMSAIHKAIVDLMSECLKELSKSANVDVSTLDQSNAFSKSFHRVLRSQLDPVWHQTSRKTKQLVNDLEVLRRLASFLVKYDCVTFFEYLDALKKKEAGDKSLWMMMDQANTIFQYARARVFKTTKNHDDPLPKRTKLERDFGSMLYSPPVSSPAPVTYEYSLQLEQNPKWQVLDEIICEIRGFPPIKGQHGPVLVVCRDEAVKLQVNNYLQHGGQEALKKSFLDYVHRRQLDRSRHSTTDGESSAFTPSWRGRARGRAGRRGMGMAGTRHFSTSTRESFSTAPLTPIDIFLDKAAAQIENEEIDDDVMRIQAAISNPIEGVDEYDAFFGLLTSVTSTSESIGQNLTPLMTVVTFENFEWTLNSLHPQYIIMFDTDVTLVRNVEIYKAYNPGLPCKVYFMTMKDSADELMYKSAIEKEKAAFTALIKEKERLVVTEEQDGKLLVSKIVSDQVKEAEAELNSAVTDDSSRKGGQLTSGTARPQVLVDTREFRSKLPSLLHLSGFEVIPITLEIGDYIISPDVCIERKSIADLHGSFQSGRLFTQAENLTRHYASPVLLIEFDESQAFALEEEALPDTITVTHIISKIVLLTQSFPQLRIIWSNSPHNTAQLIKVLKEGQLEPTDQSSGVRPHHRLLSDDAEVTVAETAFESIDLLKKMAGVTSHNLPLLARSVKSLRELAGMKKAELQKLIGKGPGGELFAALHDTLFPDDSRKVKLND